MTAELKVGRGSSRGRERGGAPCRGVEFIDAVVVALCCGSASTGCCIEAGAYSSGLRTLEPDGLERTFLPPSKDSSESAATLKQELCLLQGSCVLSAQRQMPSTCVRGTRCAAAASSILGTDAPQLFTYPCHLINPGVTLNLPLFTLCCHSLMRICSTQTTWR